MNAAMKFAALLAFGASCAAAQDIPAKKVSIPARIWHYVGTHKELLSADTLTLGSMMLADGAAAHSAAEVPGSPPYPQVNYFKCGIRYGLIFTTANHLLYKYSYSEGDPDMRHLAWMWTAPVVFVNVHSVFENSRNKVPTAAEINAR
jgi:hypothetical protein